MSINSQKKHSSRYLRGFFSKGFTLIELLIVIAILGVLAAGILVAIDPVDKIKSAQDAQVQNDVSNIGKASERYTISHNGFYPAALGDLISSGELKRAPIAPTGYVYTFTSLWVNSPLPCASGIECTSIVITSPLKSKRFTATPFWRYDSQSGKSCASSTEHPYSPCL